ncbi:MAG: YraN family protein [Thermomicrobiales bacterium]|nr:YraN family protein [Thermomicrobiales bacterium]
MPDDRKAIGTRAEQHVRSWLEAKGYRHLYSNWRMGHGELDLVMEEGDELVFVEVKARRSDWAGYPEEGVSKKQASTLLRTGELYTQVMPGADGRIWRIDLVGVSLTPDGEIDEIRHYINAIVIG